MLCSVPFLGPCKSRCHDGLHTCTISGPALLQDKQTPGRSRCFTRLLVQERNRLPDVADDELNVPPPEPLHFNIDEPALLDDDMVEILLLEEASPEPSPLRETLMY